MQRSYTHCTTFPDQQGNNLTVRYTADIERSHELLTAAFVWLGEGVSIVPVQPKSKKCLLNWRRFEANPPADSDIYRWFENGVMNLAVVGGSGGLLVLDFDQVENYQVWAEKAGSLAQTYTERSARGYHLFYLVDDPITRKFQEAESLGRGHLCTVAPSIHPSGAVYSSPDVLAPLIRTQASDIFSLLSALPESTREPARPAETRQLTPAKNDLIGRIKQCLSTLAYAETLTPMKPSGTDARWWNGRCPFHDDQEASFWVDSLKGLYGCFVPDCRAHRGGDLLNLYSLSKGITIQQAVKLLAAELLK